MIGNVKLAMNANGTAMRMFGDYENEFIKLQLNYERSDTHTRTT